MDDSLLKSYRGLREGDELPCLLFYITLEGGCNRSSQFVCFADNRDIGGRMFENVTDLHPSESCGSTECKCSNDRVYNRTEHDRVNLGSR